MYNNAPRHAIAPRTPPGATSRTRQTTKERGNPTDSNPHTLSFLALSLTHSIVTLQHSPLLHLKRIPSLAPTTNNSPIIILPTPLHTLLPPLLRPQRPIRSMPLGPKRRPRVQHAQQHHRKRNHRPVQNQKLRLIVPQLPLEPAPKLHRAEDRPRQNRQSRNQKRHQERLESELRPQRVPRRDSRVRPAPPHSDEKVQRHGQEDRQRDALQHQAGDHDVDAGLLEIWVGVRRGVGYCAAGGLQD